MCTRSGTLISVYGRREEKEPGYSRLLSMTPTFTHLTISILAVYTSGAVSLCRRNHKERRAPLHRHRGREQNREVGGEGKEEKEEEKEKKS